MPKTYKVFRFKIKGKDVDVARKLSGFDRLIFEFEFESGSTTALKVKYLIAARSDNTKIQDVKFQSHPAFIFWGDYADATLAQDFLSRPYKITQEMLNELDSLNSGKTLDKLKFVARPTSYRHSAGNSSDDADPTDAGKEFIQLKVEADY